MAARKRPPRTKKRKPSPRKPSKGKAAPAFTLNDAHGRAVTLAKLRGKKVVLYFYPKDDTPGCTVEAREFSGLHKDFNKRNALIFGVSRDNEGSHRRFADKCALAVPLLSDPGGKICRKYGVLKEKTLYGKKALGVARTTFLVDEKGKVAKVWSDVRPEGHAREVLDSL